MYLTITQLKELESICWLARSCFEKTFDLPEEQRWLEQIAFYRDLLQAEIDRRERVECGS